MTTGKTIYVLALATALALAVAWQGARLRRTGYRVQELKEAVAQQQYRCDMYRAHLSKLKSPQRITALVEWLGLDLLEQPPHLAESALAEATQPEPQDPPLAVARVPGW